ncbi:hypothetical protein B4099_0371 [Heyndrickxia coagulans]|uniref:Uncharacterized protein n=1 Tax=Heyndrickxia coagulans TaxID=1398 RepID=A0A150K8H4_HEYCO|nr:hypothetical protein B4099_0371 [Heyndrickxia coagulans]
MAFSLFGNARRKPFMLKDALAHFIPLMVIVVLKEKFSIKRE